MDVTLASTTDTQEQVNRAAGIEPEAVVEPSVVAEPQGTEVEETETAPASDTGQQEKKQGKGRFSKRIDELTRERYEAQAEASRLREQLEQIQSQVKIEPAPKLATPEGKPQRSNYTSDELWVEDLTAWKAKESIAAERRAEQERQRQQRDQNVHVNYMQRADEFTEQHDDFNQVVNSIRLYEDIAGGVQAAIMGRPNGPEVAYYLGSHPEIVSELNEMNAADAVAEIGALSYGLLPKVASPKPAARVPAPLTPVGGSSRVAQSLSDLDTDDYIAARRRQRAEAGRRR